MKIEVVEQDLGNDVMELTVRGSSEKVIRLLATGLPAEDLRKIAAAFQSEIDKQNSRMAGPSQS